MRDRGGTYRVLVGGKYHFGRDRYRWEDNIKIDLQETGSRRGLG